MQSLFSFFKVLKLEDQIKSDKKNMRKMYIYAVDQIINLFS